MVGRSSHDAAGPMKSRICFLLGLFSSWPAHAQLTAERLQGVSVSATILEDVRVLRDGQERQSQNRWIVEFRIGPSGVIDGSYRLTVFREGNYVASDGGDFSQTIGKPGMIKQWKSLWLFQDNSLIMLFARKRVGGAQAIFTFYPTEGDLKCSVKTANVLEVGKGNSRARSAYDGYPIKLLSSRQLSSSCHATRQ